jgi:hypothetical protein
MAAGWIVLVVLFSGLVAAQSDDAQVLSAAIAHYSNSKKNPLLVVAGETLDERNAQAQPVGEIQLPANAMLVRNAVSLTRHVSPNGAEVEDWSPFTHAYPGYQLVQLSAPVYSTPGARARVYLRAGIGPEGTEGWLYTLEKRGNVWQVLLVVEDEREQHVHLILDDLAVLQTHLLLFDPRASYVANGLVSARQAAVDRVLEALG